MESRNHSNSQLAIQQLWMLFWKIKQILLSNLHKNKPNDTQAIVWTFDTPNNDDIHFCINMLSSGNRVEIRDNWE
ncbi:unnamed protein product [Paramecium octaurelia]|uniref:Uncharacterized protein n=1 Tax=Paramecium octaurelia TaxID=43137 RepID=A0A8S1YKJ3_PAROT|nr:unnamed protein product [Paramecium octaurelia]